MKKVQNEKSAKRAKCIPEKAKNEKSATQKKCNMNKAQRQSKIQRKVQKESGLQCSNR